MDEQVSELLGCVAADVALTGLTLRAGVFDLAAGRWVAGAGDEVPADFGDEGYVTVLPGRQHLLPADPDGLVDIVSVVDDVRDWVMDELGHGWPELCDEDGGFIGVLQPVLDDDGSLTWATGDHRVPVGRLFGAPVALPPRWDGLRH